MSAANHIQVRDKRDRLIDVLNIGQTYPLRDLPVPDKQLTVAFNTTAQIPISYSQKDVLYQLHYQNEPVKRTDDKGKETAVELIGNGETIQLTTDKITKDITFDILAIKLFSGRQAYLHQTATIKVGLDTALRAWIRHAPHLTPQESLPKELMDNFARVIPYGESVEVEIEYSQEGVDYQLVTLARDEETIVSTADGRGDLRNIILTTQPIYEDVDIRIRATKKFDPSENRATQTALLDVILPLRVRANTNQALTINPAAILDYGQAGSLTIANTQSSVRYQLFIHTILDPEFVHGAAENSDFLTVKVENEPDVHIRKPAYSEVWATPAGYTPLGESQAGNGADLQFTLPALTEDSLIIVQILKDHATSLDPAVSQTVTTAVQLTETAVILTRANPAIPLRLHVNLHEGKTDGELRVQNGQPAVFYTFRKAARGKVLGLPVYFHQTDDNDANTNKGLGQLKIEVDFVVIRPSSASNSNLPPAQTPPPAPILTTGKLPTDTTLYIDAVKAQTRVMTKLAQDYLIPALPEIRMEETTINYGAGTKILVIASEERYRYQPLLNGAEFKRARLGNGEDLSFNTDSLTEDTEFELAVTHTDANTVVADRTVKLFVTVLPNAALPVTAAETVLAYNTRTEIRVQSSHPTIVYQLLANDTPLGDAVTGNNTVIALPTGNLTEDTTFQVKASKQDQPAVSINLTQQVTVQVRPNPVLTVRAVANIIPAGTVTAVEIEASQPGVHYQLIANETNIGDPVTGNGETITLPTSELNADTLFSVRAIHASDTAVFVDLTQQALVQIEAAEEDEAGNE